MPRIVTRMQQRSERIVGDLAATADRLGPRAHARAADRGAATVQTIGTFERRLAPRASVPRAMDQRQAARRQRWGQGADPVAASKLLGQLRSATAQGGLIQRQRASLQCQGEPRVADRGQIARLRSAATRLAPFRDEPVQGGADRLRRRTLLAMRGSIDGPQARHEHDGQHTHANPASEQSLDHQHFGRQPGRGANAAASDVRTQGRRGCNDPSA